MARKNTNNNTTSSNASNAQTDAERQAELRKSARGKKVGDRTAEEQAAVEAFRAEAKERQQAQMTEAITKAVGLNATITSAASLPIVDRIEALRDALVNVEAVRAEIADAVRSQAFRGSVDVIIEQARVAAVAAWDGAMAEVRKLTDAE
jgi:hypothetical protein